MAILQAIFAFLARSVGKIFSALFDWAVVALFGRVSGVRKTVLSVVMAAAAAWPVLLLGVAFPRLAVLVLGFIPLSRSVPSGVVRVAWLAALLPVALARARVAGAHRRRDRGAPAERLEGRPAPIDAQEPPARIPHHPRARLRLS